MDHEQVTYLIGYNLVWREWRASEARVLMFRLFMHGYSLPQRAVAIAIGYDKLFLRDQ